MLHILTDRPMSVTARFLGKLLHKLYFRWAWVLVLTSPTRLNLSVEHGLTFADMNSEWGALHKVRDITPSLILMVLATTHGTGAG